MCWEQEPCRWVKGRGHNLHLNFVHTNSVKPICVRPITLLSMLVFKNNFAQMIIMIRRCVRIKNHMARLKVKVTVTVCIDFSETCLCSTHNLIMHGGI